MSADPNAFSTSVAVASSCQPVICRDVWSEIYHQITDVICKYEPQIAVVEQVFVSVNPQSALLLGHARGSAIVACAASELEIYEYAARQIKKSITGNGSAAKEQIQYMVQMLLSLKKMPDPDEADALAGAITHYQHMPIVDPGTEITSS